MKPMFRVSGIERKRNSVQPIKSLSYNQNVLELNFDSNNGLI
jgi:hypothetical protein